MNDAEAIEQNDDKERRENDADADAGTHATLFGGRGKAVRLKGFWGFATAGPGGFGRFLHSVLQLTNQHTPIHVPAYFFYA